MGNVILERLKYDPSDIKQTFPEINIHLHCCRYWVLKEWDCSKMAFPFWRLYYNSIGNASVNYKGITTKLTSDKILIIPPNTSYSSSLKGCSGGNINESIVGKKITSLNQLNDNNISDHLFIHFNLGKSFDLLEPGVYTFSVNGKESLLEEIKRYCIEGENQFNFPTCAVINSLILILLKEIPLNNWNISKLDNRVANAVYYIETHLEEQLSNQTLANMANMVTNSFARLFRENTGLSIQQYIKKKRIDKALILLHHSVISIDDMASQCGFSDRFHFSKVFKELMGMSPVAYRKQLTF